MRWRGGRGSRNVIDRRGRRGGRAAVGGIGGIGVLAIVLIGWFFGVDLTPLLGGGGGGPAYTEGPGEPISERDEVYGEFASSVLGYTEQIWEREFREQLGREYDPPQLVLFTGQTQTACGFGQAATGPFYCPADERAYLDTSFFDTLAQRLGAEGDFAAAYVIAHEVGHHIQNELGILSQVNEIQRTSGQAEANAMQVRVELMADCLAGIWAREVGDRYGVLEHGDLDEALNAAAQIGDDALARDAGRTVRPDTFTHGTSEQRQRWFSTGYETGSIEACDTFSAERL